MKRTVSLLSLLSLGTAAQAAQVHIYSSAFEADYMAESGIFAGLGVAGEFNDGSSEGDVVTYDLTFNQGGVDYVYHLEMDLSDARADTNSNGIPDESELGLPVDVDIPMSYHISMGEESYDFSFNFNYARPANSTTYTVTYSFAMGGGEGTSYSYTIDMPGSAWSGGLDIDDADFEGDISAAIDGHFYRVDDDTVVIKGFNYEGANVGELELTYENGAYVGSYTVEGETYYFSITDLDDSDNDGTPDLTDVDAQGFLYTKAGGSKQGGWMKLGHFGWFIGDGLGRDWYYSDTFGTWVWLDDGAGESFLIYQSDAGWLYTEKTLGLYYRYSDGHWLSFSNRTDGRTKFWDYDAGTFVWINQ